MSKPVESTEDFAAASIKARIITAADWAASGRRLTKKAVWRGLALKLLKEHERDDALPTYGRFLYYEVVQRDIISKHRQGARRSDQDLIEALTDLREAEVVPWDWILDETRSLEDYSGSLSIKQAMLDYLPHARLDLWKGRIVLVLTESRAMKGVLDDIAWRYRVRITSTGGQCAGFLHTKIVPLLKKATKPPQVLYLGDWDLAGNQIEANNRRVLEREVGELDWERIALTKEQVEGANPYGKPLPKIIKYDWRYSDGHPHEAVECEALSQKFIMELVEKELEARLPEPLKSVLAREKRQRRVIRL